MIVFRDFVQGFLNCKRFIEFLSYFALWTVCEMRFESLTARNYTDVPISPI